MPPAGIADLLVTAPVPPWGWARLAALPGRIARRGRFAGAGGVRRLAADWRWFVDINLGQHRAGVVPEAALALARVIVDTPGVTFGGIQAYCGHLQHMADRDARRRRPCRRRPRGWRPWSRTSLRPGWHRRR